MKLITLRVSDESASWFQNADRIVFDVDDAFYDFEIVRVEEVPDA